MEFINLGGSLHLFSVFACRPILASNGRRAASLPPHFLGQQADGVDGIECASAAMETNIREPGGYRDLFQIGTVANPLQP
jgi:hypothetical protein